MTEPYMPSNGTEGEWFHERMCYRCALYGDPDEGDIPPCQIQGNALAGIQPVEWIEDEHGPRCTAFRAFPLDAADPPFDPNAAIGLLL